jgi:DNA topoisomerase VI subunit A
MIIGHGMKDERTRSFVRMLEEKIDVPIFSIIDLDAYGSLIIKKICDRIQ